MGAAVFLVTHNVMEAEKAVDRLAVIADGKLLAEGTPSSLKTADRGCLRLQVMLVPGVPDPELPPMLRYNSMVGHKLVSTIDEVDAADGIAW